MAMPTQRSASLAMSPSPLILMIDGEKEHANIDVTSAQKQKQLQKGKSALLLAPKPEPAPRCLSPDTDTNSRSCWGTANTGQRLPDDLYLGVDINGKEVKLGDYRGKKVMVCFYLFTQCGVCAYSIGKLMGNYKKLAWASRLKVVTIFRTEVSLLKAGLTCSSCPIPKLLNCAANEIFPFDALADPDGRAANSFGCNTSNLLKTLLSNRKSVPKMCRRVISDSMLRKEAMFAAKHGAGKLLPSEILIDESGFLVEVMRAHKSNESMTIDRIKQFLLLGAKMPVPKKVKRGTL